MFVEFILKCMFSEANIMWEVLLYISGAENLQKYIRFYVGNSHLTGMILFTYSWMEKVVFVQVIYFYCDRLSQF